MSYHEIEILQQLIRILSGNNRNAFVNSNKKNVKRGDCFFDCSDLITAAADDIHRCMKHTVIHLTKFIKNGNDARRITNKKKRQKQCCGSMF